MAPRRSSEGSPQRRQGLGRVVIRGMLARLFGMMLSSGAMMFRGMLVMIGGLQMMFFPFFRHGARFLRLRDLG